MASLDRFDFMLAYVPALSEDQYPACFVKPIWGAYIPERAIACKPLNGRWIAIERIRKSVDVDGRISAPDDVLMRVLKQESRFKTAWNREHEERLLADVAKVMGFTKKEVHLPTLNEWVFIGNLFSWLIKYRDMALPVLGSSRLMLWCENVFAAPYRSSIGFSDTEGLAGVRDYWLGHRGDYVTLRILAEL
jgi:hypothetical protein